MIKKINIFTIICCLFFCVAASQSKIIEGIIIAKTDVDGVSILNLTASKYDITDTDGSFKIYVRPNDTLLISAMSFQRKTVIITPGLYNSKLLKINLIEKVNELDEVMVGKILTGNVGSDISNVEIKKEVNFYDLGIPGYTGKQKTIEERKLYDADHGRMFVYYGFGAAVNINKLLNKISGRTKKLKEEAAIAENDKCMRRMRDFYSKTLLDESGFTDAQKAEYFYFCLDDERFPSLCEIGDPSETISFLKEKLATYKDNLKLKDD